MSVEVSKKKILIIEDEPTQRILSKEFLEAAGYNVRLSDDGKHGLNMAMKIKPDLIMLDLMLPSVDGYSLCRFLKEAEQTAHVPIILVTASKEPDVIKRGLEAGADDFVTKPVDWQFLKDRVAFVLSQVEQKRQVDTSYDRTEVESEYDDAVRDERDLIARELEDMRSVCDSVRLAASEGDEAHARELQNLRDESIAALERSEASAVKQLALHRAQHSEELERINDGWSAKFAAREAEFVDEIRAIEDLRDRELELAGEKAQVLGAVDAEFLDERLALESKSFDERIRAMWTIVGGSCSHFEDILEKIVSQEMDADGDLLPDERSARLARQVRYLSHSVSRLGRLATVFVDEREASIDIFDAHEFLTSHVADFASFANGRGVLVDVEEMAGAVEVRGDFQQLRHAIGLLSLHALSAMPKTTSISFGAGVGSFGETLISLSVSGDALNNETFQSWANCLTSSSAARGCEEGAFNLYVPTVAAIVQRAGGRMEVESSHEHGTRMTVVLPQTKSASEYQEPNAGEALEHVA